MIATGTREIQQAISAAKRQTVRVPETLPEEHLAEYLERYLLAAQEAQNEEARRAEWATAKEVEVVLAELLIRLRLEEKLGEAPSGLDEKLRRLARSLNRKLR